MPRPLALCTLLVLTAAGCAPGTDVGPPGGSGDDDTADPADDDDDDASSPPLEQIPGGGDPTEAIFGLDQVHRVELFADGGDLAALDVDPYEYIAADMVFDGVPVGEVGLRLKGRWGSFRTLSAKAAFKIDINRFDPGKRLHGLKKLTLNNMVVDCSCAKETVAYAAFRALGVPAPRTGYMWVEINGEPYGLYLHVESVDDLFLERHFDDPSGNLYEANYVIWDNGSYTLVDFDTTSQQYYQLEEGLDVAMADIHAITDALDTTMGTGGFYEELAPLVDWEHHQWLVAGEQWTGHVDGYSLNVNNYRVYFDPARDGRAVLLPWDLDYAFIYDDQWGFDWHAPSGRLSEGCFLDMQCEQEYRLAADQACDMIDGAGLAAVLDDTGQLINDYVADDPRIECDPSYVQYYQDLLRDWVTVRSAEVHVDWGL
jgi:hypothetical protein